MPSPLGLVNSTNKYSYNIDSDNQKYKSIFNNNKFYYRPTSSNEEGSSRKSRSVHGSGSSNSRDGIYNTTTSSIIDYTSGTCMELKEQDFAYLKNYGVYPNNRLIVARRFKSPVGDDLTILDPDEGKNKPISTLISWFEDESPLQLDFGEKWEDGQGNLLDMLSDMFGKKGGGGPMDSVFRKGVPLPGFSEGLQYELLNALGITNRGLQNIPSGDPNLVQESKKRKLVDSGGGSGLKTNISIKFSTTYEQKFIGGNDPTLVYLDIINNILRFGSSESTFYINGKGGDMIRDFLEKFRKGQWLQAMGVIINAIVDVMSKVVKKLAGAIDKVFSGIAGSLGVGGDDGDGDGEGGGDDGPSISGLIQDALGTLSAATISKYKVKIGGIVSSLTGESSTPWHVTIGNPKSPIFSSGDMYTDSVNIEFGEVLAFNDLPSRITVSCTFKNARNLGIQEIFSKFNSGKARSYQNLDKTALETPTTKEDIEGLKEITEKDTDIKNEESLKEAQNKNETQEDEKENGTDQEEKQSPTI